MQTAEGVELVEKEGLVDTLVKQLRQGSNIQQRSALWALGNMGLSTGGIELVTRGGLVQEVVHLVATSPHLAMRGVCLYILNMFSHTP